jgi:mannose-6-phosphate isomerase-like protein (cupin superfamily)
MHNFSTKMLPRTPDVTAPDGSNVRILLSLDRGSMAHFELLPGETSVAVAHRTIEEIWYFLTGKGEMWRKLETQEEIVFVEAGVCLTIPVGTHFQFRTSGEEPLSAIGITMPPWPGEDEAYEVEGKWKSTIQPK